MWPQFDFSISRELDGDNPAVVDIDPDGDGTAGITLTGAECLVAFLGGVIDATGVPTGFSKNPANPFATGGNREGPFFEFQGGATVSGGSITFSGRFVDINNNRFPEYLDTLSGQTRPYLYLSSYDGRGYNLPADLPTYLRPPMLSPAFDLYRQANSPTAAPYKANSFQIISPGRDAAYGTGGYFSATDAACLSAAARQVEWDNITNFHGGALRP
jgi:hypothetical protein